MKSNVIKNVIWVFLILLMVGVVSIPIIQDINFGLDLKGGFEVLYQIDTVDGSELTSDVKYKLHETYVIDNNGEYYGDCISVNIKDLKVIKKTR